MSFERIQVEVLGDSQEWDSKLRRERRYPADALLVEDAKMVGVLGGGEVWLRLPASIEVGERIALRREPPVDQVFDVLTEEQDMEGRPLYRARIARLAGTASWRAEAAKQARIAAEWREVEMARHRRFIAEQRREKEERPELLDRTDRALAALDDDALEALVRLLDPLRGSDIKENASEIVERARRHLAGEESAALSPS